MSYCDNQDVIDEFKKLDVTGGLITTSKIDEWINQADAYINGRIGLIYTTPVTGTSSLLILKQISVGLVAGRVKRILKTKSASSEASQEFPDGLIAQAKSDLKLIANKGMKLSDATEVSSSGGVSSYTSENDVDFFFKRDVTQW